VQTSATFDPHWRSLPVGAIVTGAVGATVGALKKPVDNTTGNEECGQD